MKSLKRLFGRKSTRKVTRRTPFRLSRPIGYASHVERLEDRTLLASNILASLESSVNQPNDTTDLVLNVGSGSSPTLGFEVKAAPGSVFDPAAIRIFDANTNAVIPLNLAEHDHAGSTNSLVLATLSPGEYRVEVQGQSSAIGGFIVDVFLPGDSDGNGSVNDDEYRHALAASYQHLFGYNHHTTQLLVQQMGLDPSTNFYRPELDGDMDGDVDNNDLNLMNANRNIPTVQFELIGDQDAPASFIELQLDSGISDSDGITNDLTVVGTLSDESQITQFKVGLDGAAFSSFVDILPQLSGGANGGSFTLTRSWLETNLNGGASLEGGTHTLHFFGQDEHDNNNMGAFYDLTFELDVTAPTTMYSFGNVTEDEDFGSSNLGPKTTFFNQNGGTPLSFQFDSITSPIVTLDDATSDLILESILHANGSADIVIRATDVAGNFVLSNSFNVMVNALNDAPVAIDDLFTTNEDTVLNGASNVFAANPTTPDSDVENDPFTVTEVNGMAASVGNQITLSSGALLTLNANGTFSYDPNGAFEDLADGDNASDSFTYTIDDGTGSLVTTDTATVTITITGVNDDPVAIDDVFTTDENTVLTGGGVLAANPTTADSDVESQRLRVAEVNGQLVIHGSQITLPSGALLTMNDDGTFSYDPNGQFENLADGDNGSDSFTYTITDAQGGTDSATVNLTITGVNDDPVAINDAFTTDEDTVLNGASSVFTANPTTADSDVEGQSFTVTGVTGGAAPVVGSQFALTSGALLTINANGTFTYDPNGAFENLAAGDNGSDSFTYTITDAQGGTDSATVNLTITGVNDDPVAIDDA
ncbi:MAG: tandem-95 repeat protein, partial [Planctomycetes bacterium]|nr:tandem-95 repeat protein [Planctomycetota bacterium]